jgi:hypothetical protein
MELDTQSVIKACLKKLAHQVRVDGAVISSRPP